MNAYFEPFAGNSGHESEGCRAEAVACAVLMPHAPVLVPGVGGDRGEEAQASCRAMRKAAACVMGVQPETVVVISPHSPRKSGAFGLWSDPQLQGSFEQFNTPQAWVSLPNDRSLANTIAAEAHSRQVKTWHIRNCSLDHGALVPLWFLAEAGWAGPTVVLSLDFPGEGDLTRLGEAIASAASELRRCVAIVASGDMSHRLTASAPCGFHPLARQFDENFIRLIRVGDYRDIQNIDAELRESAAEDVVDSTLVAAAATGWNVSGHEVLSYEGPFGVGYGVAILFANESRQQVAKAARLDTSDGESLPGLARRSVDAALRNSSESPPTAMGDYLQSRHGVFVTVRCRNGELRGCVGTCFPVCDSVIAETWRNARLAAFQDNRFPVVMAKELADLRFEVSVIHSVEDVCSPDELDPQHYGVIVSAAQGRCGVLLPRIEGIDTIESQLFIARKKAWIDPGEPVSLQRFQVDHFEEPG